MPARRVATQSESRLERLPASYLERLVESSSDIVVAVDRAGMIIYYNDGAEKGLGYAAHEILGQHVARIYPSKAEAHRVMEAMRSEEFGGPGKVKNFETTFVTRWVLIGHSVHSLIFESGNHGRQLLSFNIGFSRKLGQPLLDILILLLSSGQNSRRDYSLPSMVIGREKTRSLKSGNVNAKDRAEGIGNFALL